MTRAPDARLPEQASDPLVARVQVARRLASEAGQILMRYYERDLGTVEAKGAVDFVTRADKESERHILKELGRLFPEDRVWAEETGGSFSRDGRGWLIDPLDGTTNFLHGLPLFGVSMGLMEDGRPVGGVVEVPALGESYFGWRGGGAYLGDRAIRVSRTKELSASLLATGFPYDRREVADRLLARVKSGMMEAHGVRRCGAAVIDLCWLAAGRFDGFFEEGLQPWDTCAGVAIAEEAGAVVSDYAGAPFDPLSAEIVASNGLIHEELLARVVVEASGRAPHAPGPARAGG